MIICRQKNDGGCKNYARYRYTWPGNDESFICDSHSTHLRNVAAAMGLHLQLISLTEADHLGPVGMQPLEEQKKDG